MRSKIAIIALLSAMLVFAFQNCADSGGMPEGNSEPVAKVKLENFLTQS